MEGDAMFEKSLFEATAWILLARMNQIATNGAWFKEIASGEWNTDEVAPFWAGLVKEPHWLSW